MSFDPHFYSVKGGNMIDRDKTIKEFGYDPDNLKSKSGKSVFRLCANCGREQIVQFRARDKLCISCVQKGDKNAMYGKTHSKEARQKISKNHANVSGKNNPMYGTNGKTNHNWKGGRQLASARNRSKRHNFLDSNPIFLNKPFKDSNAHHVNTTYIIHIPKNIHNSMYHRQRDGMGMHNINKFAFKYLINNKENITVSIETAYYINLMCL